MLTRVVSGFFLVVILVLTMFFGGWVLYGAILFISLIGFGELIRAMKVRSDEKKPCMVELIGYFGILLYYIVLALGKGAEFAMAAIILTIMLMLLVYVLSFPKYHASQIMSAVFSYIYAPILLSYIYRTRMLEDGIYIIWLVFICSWICDTSAYFVGVLFGKHKLAPVLSPKKSIEGAVGGVCGSFVVGFLYALVLYKAGIESRAALIAFPIISAVGAVLSQIGDLAASGIKRNHEIKDYGKLIPGHGGIMDRFDSVIVTAPLIFYGAMLMLLLK